MFSRFINYSSDIWELTLIAEVFTFLFYQVHQDACLLGRQSSVSCVFMSFRLLSVCSVYRFSVDKDHLVVTDVSDDDGGMYTCAANTTLDSVSASAVLRVVGKSENEYSTARLSVLGGEEKLQRLNMCLL